MQPIKKNNIFCICFFLKKKQVTIKAKNIDIQADGICLDKKEKTTKNELNNQKIFLLLFTPKTNKYILIKHNMNA